MQPKLYKLAFITFTILTALWFVFARNGYPLFTQDSGCFVPAAWFINNVGKLINPIYDANIDTVSHRFIFYPPLFAYVTAWVSTLVPHGWDIWHTALTLLDVSAIAILLYAIYLDTRNHKPNNSKWFYAFTPLLVLTIFAFQGVSTGRPEILCRLFISLFILNNLRKTRITYLANGTLIALNTITSPISTFYMVAIAGYYMARGKGFTLKNILQTIAGAIPVLIIFLTFYPYPLGEALKSVLTHSRNTAFHYTGKAYLEVLIRKYINVALTPLPIVPFIICFIYLVHQNIKNRQWLAGAFVILLAVLVYVFTFRYIVPSYNLFVLSPFMCLLLVRLFINANNQISTQALKWIRPLLILMMLVNCSGLLRTTISLLVAQNKYVTAASFRNTFINIVSHTKPQKKILITVSLWPYCLDKSDRVLEMKSFNAQDTMLRDTTVQYVMFQQYNSGLSKPLYIPGFRLVEDQFINGGKKIAGLTLFNTYPGYQVAIYERK